MTRPSLAGSNLPGDIVCFSFYVLGGLFGRYRARSIASSEMVLWSLFGLCVAITVLMPKVAQGFASLLGVQRGADAIFYVAIVGLVEDFKKRTGGRVPDLITSDEYQAYPLAILNAYGQTVTPPRTGRPGRPAKAYQVPPEDLR